MDNEYLRGKQTNKQKTAKVILNGEIETFSLK